MRDYRFLEFSKAHRYSNAAPVYLIRDDFPELGTDLVAALACLNMG
jgi:hypothetical protein